ncbi:MAG: bifunctional isocitrate dehydrogenase kinase/phosphatase [Thiotrichales bacterium]
MSTTRHRQEDLVHAIAETLLEGFNKHFRIYQAITAQAKDRFEQADWRAVHEASRGRIALYDQRVNEAMQGLLDTFGFDHLDETLWQKVKIRYVQLLQTHYQPELAETFYNSVFCRLFHRSYFNNDYIFLRSAVSTEYIESDRPAYRVFYPGEIGLRTTVSRVLNLFGFQVPWQNHRRDVRDITQALIEFIRPRPQPAHLNLQIQVINALFYRNKAAYIVGRAVNDVEVTAFALPILNSEHDGLYVDTLLLGKRAVSQLFEFSYVYFMVEHPVPSAIVSFLEQLLPERSKSDLYSAIGFHKQGKNAFYRDFLHHLKYSEDHMIIAPGIRGMVMEVFTLPSYPYVFKVIKDRFAPPKEIDRKTVEAKYQLVKQHDRVGRMADMLEYSYVTLPKQRFARNLLDELLANCAESIELDGDSVVIKHVYIERRMIPLNMYLDHADDEQTERLMLGYGEAIKQLAAANIFPGDMLLKNFGVTPLGRVVFYDYDEVCYLTECNFRRIPPPRYPEDEMAAEPWYSVGPMDVFPEEFERFLLNNPRIRRAFNKFHRDLLAPEFWWQRQKNIQAGIYEDVFPYPERMRFRNRAAG